MGVITVKKILHISKYYYPFLGGIEQVARDVVNALKSPETEQKVICFNEDASDGEMVCHRDETTKDIVDEVQIIRCGYNVKISSQAVSASYGKELRQVMDSYKPDIVILHYPNPFVSHLLLKYKKRSFKLIVYWHLDITKQKILGKLFHRQNLALLKRAEKVIATSPNYIEGSPYLNRYREKCVVIPNCINLDKLTVTEKSRELCDTIRHKYSDRTICFSVGRHVPYKGYSYLIKAAKLLDNRFIFCIGGSGPLTNQLKKEAAGCENIEFLGRISDEELVAYCLACDIFCFPSITKNEAFGIALAEGMYFGKPAVTFTIPGSGVNYVNLDGVTGIECPNRDSRAYARALKRLAEKAELRKEYGEKGHERVLEKFTYDEFKTDIYSLIKAEIENAVL